MRKRDSIRDFLNGILRKLIKAAPRFELGIKDLQSSALPLGHAATQVVNAFGWHKDFTTVDSIKNQNKSLLVISNGHGEDLIALRILEAIHEQKPDLKIEILPLVGQGKVFEEAIHNNWLIKIGPSLRLPSGGFSNQSLRALFADIFAGLFLMTWKQWLYVKWAGSNGRVILAVGDLLPLFFAWTSKACFGFIGTPKSDYTWKSSFGTKISDYYHYLKGTEWDPWEWILMKSGRCKMVGIRDQLTARGLIRKGVKAICLGNPMMDGFKAISFPYEFKQARRLLLLCGSRNPEALDNLRRLMESVIQIRTDKDIVLLIALGSEPIPLDVDSLLNKLGFSKSSNNVIESDAYYERERFKVFVGVGRFYSWASIAEVGIANAGTATEQLVGSGVPSLSLPGKGPQFQYSFAIRQSRLLGGAVIPCKSSKQLALRLEFLLKNTQFRNNLSHIGFRRMGPQGASKLLASSVLKSLLDV